MHKIYLFFLGVVTAILSFNSMAYDRAVIENRTTFPAKVHVTYAACKSDTFDVPAGTIQKDALVPGTDHAPTKRGGCGLDPVTQYRRYV